MSGMDRGLTVRDMTYGQLAKTIDHSLLRPELTLTEVREGCELASKYDVDPGTAFARKEEYDPGRPDAMARLYREAAADLGVRPLIEERSREDLCAETGADASRALP